MSVDLTGAVTNLALKEWSGVVEALLAGRPLVLLRKGGIAEKGFAISKEPFWLFPTWSHQQEQGLSEEAKGFVKTSPVGNEVILSGWAQPLAVWNVINPDLLESLKDWHLLKHESVEKRFHYRHPGLTVLAVEAFKLDVPKEILANPAWEGCHSWVCLDRPESLAGGKSCLNSAECDGMLQALEVILGKPGEFALG